MNLSEIGKLSGFDPKDIRHIMIQGRHYRSIHIRGDENVNWGEIDLGVEIFMRSNQITIYFKQGHGKPILPHWLGLDQIRFLNDEKYAEDLKKNW